MKKPYLYVFVFFIGTLLSFSQITDSLNIVKEDSAKIEKNQQFYQKINDFFKKRKITQNIHNFLFENQNRPESAKSAQKELNRNYSKYQGKIIRNIEITTLDPFGFDEKDLTITPSKKIDIYGNALHTKTKSSTIKKLLFFSENTRMDSMLLKESERLLREQRYIRRALIRPVEIAAVSDSVDVQITVLDSWSMFVDSDLTDKRGWVRLSERNLFGLGHEASITYRQYFKKFSDNGKGIYYRAKNIRNTQIDAITSYYDDLGEFSKRLAFERPLYSPYARWTGSIGHYDTRYKEEIYIADSLQHIFLRKKIYDMYAGYVIPLEIKKAGELSSLIISTRYRKTHFAELPSNYYNSENFYSDETFYLTKINIEKASFAQDRYIFKHGDIEDVSIGHSLFVTSGVFEKHNLLQPYFGLGGSLANYTPSGYFSIHLEGGSLFINGKNKQTTIRGESNYFSNLFMIGNWHLRQFFKTSFVVGLNRTSHPNDRVSINGIYGIDDFRSNVYDGTRKLILTSQTQTYSPFDWFGFRFNPFFVVDVGLIGRENKPFFQTEIYPKLALGFYISNDYLVFQNFQFSLCFFPKMPGVGSNIFKITNTQNDDFRLQNFGYKPPNMVIYK